MTPVIAYDEIRHGIKFREIMDYNHKEPSPEKDMLRDLRSELHRRPKECPCGNPLCDQEERDAERERDDA